MTTDFLHGVEVIEVQSGPRPIEFKRSAVIGLIGTAPDSEAAVAARLDVGSEALDNGVRFTAVTTGAAGNQVAIYLKAVAANQTLAVAVAQRVITVTLETDGTGAVASTAGEVIAALAASEAASALVTASAIGTSDGTGLMPINNRYAYLAGGLDEAFPLNTPTLIVGRRIEGARLGAAGTLPPALDAIFDHAATLVVVVRVAEGVDDAATLTNFMGGDTAQTGVHAFVAAEPTVGVKPKILVAPNWSSELALATELDGVAHRLKAIAVVEGPSTTDTDALDFRANFASERVYLVDPRVQIFATALNAYRYEGASARVAGIMAANDLANGWHTSPSNKAMRGITGTERAIDFALSDSASRANLLNEHDVAVIIRHEGWRLWGNRTCSPDPQWQFINVRRAADMAYEALEASHLWAVDRNITRTYVEDVLESVNAYLAHLTAIGAVIGGRCWADEELNTPDQIALGRVYFDFDFTPPYPAERITFRSHLVNDYLVEIIPAAA